jgi:dolichol-phosphate mannosyltransferase
LIGIVIPTYNEEDNLGTLLPDLHNTFPPGTKIMIMDNMSTDNTKQVAKEYGCIIPFCDGVPFGQLIKLGLGRAIYEEQCDAVITMDADHKSENAHKLFQEYQRSDNNEIELFIGYEQGMRTTRRVTNILIRYGLDIILPHPTCGLRLYRKSLIEKIPLGQVRAEWFAVQIELLQMIKFSNLESTILSVKFPSEEHGGATNKPYYIYRWLLTYFRLFFNRVARIPSNTLFGIIILLGFLGIFILEGLLGFTITTPIPPMREDISLWDVATIVGFCLILMLIQIWSPRE